MTCSANSTWSGLIFLTNATFLFQAVSENLENIVLGLIFIISFLVEHDDFERDRKRPVAFDWS